MSTKRGTDALSSKLLIWFAVNPEEELTSHDIRDRWDIPCSDSVRLVGRRMCRQGWLTRELRKNPSSPSGRTLFYSAGPALRANLT